MATLFKAPVNSQEFECRPRSDIDRKALRARLNKQYKNTLAYLGR